MTPQSIATLSDVFETAQSNDTQQVPFAAPEDPYAFGPALGIVFPGLTDESAQPDEPLKSKLGDLLVTLATADTIAHAQLLVTPGDRGLNVIVSGSSSMRPIRENGQQRLVETSTFETIVEKAKGCLPDIYGLEKVHVDLGPLGRSAPHVSRLAVHGDQKLVVNNMRFLPSVRMLKALWSARDSFVYQFILEEANPFIGTVRLATFNPEYIKRSDKGFAEIVDRGHPRSLKNIYEPTNLTDNHHLRVKDYWQTSYTPHSGSPPGYSVAYSTKVTEPDYRYRQTKQQADRLKALVTGASEYERLLRGGTNYDNLYQKLDQYPRFTLTGPQIDIFTALPQLRYHNSPWDELISRDGPTVKTQEIIRDADGTEQGLYTQTTASSTSFGGSTSMSVSNRGSRMHDETVHNSKPWFEQQGDQVEIVEQTTKSLPDLKLYPTDGNIVSLGCDIETEFIETGILPPERLEDRHVVVVEVEHENGAASTLANATKAAIDGRLVIFIATSEDKAETIAELLARPFQETINDGVVIHTWTEKIVCEDGTKPVLPADADQKRWEFTYDGRLRLRQTETDAIIVDEPAENAPSTFSFDCPFLRIEDGEYVVYGPDGEKLRTYGSKEAFKRDWTYIYKPHVPVELSYIERSLIMYLDTEPESKQFELERYRVDPDWNVSDNRERYEEMIESVVADLLIEQEGTELDLKRWRQRILRMYRRQTDRKEPDEGKIGEAMPDIDTKQRNNPYQRLYKNHTFAFPEGIVSPALPGVDTDDSRLLEWAQE